MTADEHDDVIDPAAPRRSPLHAAPGHARSTRRVPKLMARVVAGASQPLRADLLACLLRPLGPLALLAIASGAFARHFRRDRSGDLLLLPDGFAHHSSEQISELVLFVEQVSPDALNQFAALLADSQLGVATFSAAVAMVLVQALHGVRQRRRRNAAAQGVR